VFSTVFALIVAGVLSKTAIRGPKVPLILEMPPYRRPHWPSILRMLRQRATVFVRDAGSVILVAAIIIWALLEFPRTTETDRDFASERQTIEQQLTAQQTTSPEESTLDMPMAALEEALANIDQAETAAQLENSYGGRIGRLIEPTIAPLGFDWKMGIGLVGAFAAREVFVGTMGVIYGIGEDADETSPMLRDKLRNERRPDGTKAYTPLVCLSLLVFFALACQCMSTVAMVGRETASWRWPTFLVVYTFALAWFASFVVYQGGQLLGFT
jgi:ferrous iron transport protein B